MFTHAAPFGAPGAPALDPGPNRGFSPVLTTGLIYAIKELISVINSAGATAQIGPHSQLWSCHNPHTLTHTLAGKKTAHSDAAVASLRAGTARQVSDEEKDVNKGGREK